MFCSDHVKATAVTASETHKLVITTHGRNVSDPGPDMLVELFIGKTKTPSRVVHLEVKTTSVDNKEVALTPVQRSYADRCFNNANEQYWLCHATVIDGKYQLAFFCDPVKLERETSRRSGLSRGRMRG